MLWRFDYKTTERNKVETEVVEEQRQAKWERIQRKKQNRKVNRVFVEKCTVKTETQDANENTPVVEVIKLRALKVVMVQKEKNNQTNGTEGRKSPTT